MHKQFGALRVSLAGLLDTSPSHLVAAARLVLAAFALIAIWADPAQPALHEVTAYWILAGYLVAAVGLMAAALWLPLRPVVEVAVHVGEIVLLSLLMLLTEGPTSPVFVLFTFALFSATLRWGWRGGLATGIALVAIFVTMGVLYVGTNSEEEVARRIVRGGHLVVAAVLLAYLAFLLERSRERLARLAVWPEEPPAQGAAPPICAALRHATATIDARAAVVLWEAGEEPWLHWAVAEDDACRFGREPPREDGAVDAAVAAEPFLLLDAVAGLYRKQGGRRLLRGQPLRADLVERHGIGQAVVTPLPVGAIAGHLVMVDPRRLSDELLPLAAFVARQIGGAIAEHAVRREREEAAALRERTRLARDVHDGLLQALAAMSMRIRAAAALPEAELQRAVGELAELVTGQQRRLRSFVEGAREADTEDRYDLSRKIEAALGEVARQWGCEAELEVEPAAAHVPPSVGMDLYFIVSEAVANAVRHAKASRIAVRIERNAGALDVRIWDNGAPPEGRERVGMAMHGLPRSLRERAEALGAQISFSFQRGGRELFLRMPLL
jgi:signal transduction histidine kinase